MIAAMLMQMPLPLAAILLCAGNLPCQTDYLMAKQLQ
jgi:hypothetical protein